MFVCDGYDGSGFFHINWGWGPTSQGYYLLSILEPAYEESYDGYISEGFSSGQGAIIGLQPITDNEQIEKKCYVPYFGWGTSGINIGPGLFKNRENSDCDFALSVAAYVYTNKACTDFFSGEMAFNIYKDEKFISTCYWVKDAEKETDSDGRRYWNVSFGAGYDDGEYTLKVFYKSEDGNLYEADCEDMMIVTIDGDCIDLARKSKNPNSLITNYVVNSIEYEAPPIIDEENSVVISITNTGESHAQDVCFYIGDYEYALSNGTAYFEPGETGTVKLKFTPNTYGKKKVEIASTRPKFIYNKQNEKIPDPNYHALYEGLINIYAKSSLYFNDVYCVVGQQKNINVYFQKIDCDIKKAQFTVHFPEGLTFQAENINDGNAFVVRDEYGNWQISIDKIDNYDDKIFSIPIVADKDLKLGDYFIIVDNIEIYDTNDEQISLLAFESKVKVGKEPISFDGKNIHLSEAGTLSYYIDDKYNVEELKITGEINGTDFRFIRDMSGNNHHGELTSGKLKVLDLSEAKIVAGGEMYLDTDRIKSRRPNNYGLTGSMHYYVTEDNVLPHNVFCNLLLTDIKLPETLKSLENYALGGCDNLRKLVIPFGVTSIGNDLGMDYLEELIIPSSVESLLALWYSKSLKRVVLCNNTLMGIAKGDYEQVTFVVQKGLKEKYQKMCSWMKGTFEEEDFITIKTNPVTISEGENIPTFTYSVTGGELEGEPHFYCEADGKTPGVYDIVIMQGSVSNEKVIFENGELTVAVNKYKLTYIVDGKEYKSLELEYGATITPEPAPVKEGYTFSGWSEIPETMPDHDVTVTGTFKAIPDLFETIKMAVASGDRTAIGYSSANGLDFTNVTDVKAWVVTGFTADATVLLSRVKIVPPNTGLYLTSDVAGVEVNVPTTDRKVYYANLLLAAVNEETIDPTEVRNGVEYTNFVVGKLNSGEMGFVRVKNTRTLGPNKSRLLVPSSYYPVSNQAPELQVTFTEDGSTTNLQGIDVTQQSDSHFFDLQGRKLSVGQAQKGIYIYKGKKYVIK